MMDFHQASEGTFLHHANWQHHQWLTSDLLTDENAGGITVEVILCKYSRQPYILVKLRPRTRVLQTGARRSDGVAPQQGEGQQVDSYGSSAQKQRQEDMEEMRNRRTDRKRKSSGNGKNCELQTKKGRPLLSKKCLTNCQKGGSTTSESDP